MADTRVNSATLMHPQERNVHNKVFGGCVQHTLRLAYASVLADEIGVADSYLMRLAYETAYSTACLFARSAVTFVALECVCQVPGR